MAMFIAFATMARDVVLQVLVVSSGVDDDPHLLRLLGSVIVLLSAEVRKAIEETGAFALLCDLDFDVCLEYITFQRTVEMLWSDKGRISWFRYS